MSAKIKETTYGNRDTIKIVTRDDITPMKKVTTGSVLQYEGHVIQEIVNESTGETFDSITVKTRDGGLYATRSTTFIKNLVEIVETLKDDPDPIDLLIVRGTAKNGNEFLSCALN